MKRREFLVKSGYSCLAISGLGFLLTECKSASIKDTENELIIPVSLMKKKNNLLVSSKHVMEKILVVRGKDGTYHSLLMKCSHKGYELVKAGDKLVCNSHGSTFDFDGNVTNKPAKTVLKRFPVTSNGNEIIVHLV
jgi:nitrite reductase/ring-hydroxylating ferredoxin subunit